jgi:hypothetical protein
MMSELSISRRSRWPLLSKLQFKKTKDTPPPTQNMRSQDKLPSTIVNAGGTEQQIAGLFSTSSETEKINTKYTTDSLDPHINEESSLSGSLETLEHNEGMAYIGI